jgi:hypothetical protein
MAKNAPPRLSVLITSYDSPDLLRLCLASLSSQTEVDEIVVADCSPVSPADWLALEFPGVRLVRSAPRRVPELRWASLPSVSGEIVGALEARCPPSPDWARLMVAEHLAHPEAPAAGGPVASGPARTAFALGLYLCEYGEFAPPLPPGPAEALSGANLCYKREALEENRDLLDAGAWETVLHERWRRQGRELRLCGASVAFHNTMAPGAALRQRFHYGRDYAAERIRYGAASFPAVYGLLAPLLPLVLTFRMAWRALTRGSWASFLRASLWIFALNTAWSAGEAAGYLWGPDPEPRIF